jgi:probable rRNA maturation factor
MSSASIVHRIRFHFPYTAFSLTERRRLKLFLATLFRGEGQSFTTMDYVFCSDKALLDINKTHLQHNYYTDIITFNLSDAGQPVTGEIYISIDRVRDNAQDFDQSFRRELHRVIFHGALHLCGYKDKKPKDVRLMRDMEDKYLKRYFGK